MPTTRPRVRSAALLVVALLAPLLAPLPVAAREARVTPTGTPADYDRVREAMRGLAAGDTLTLEAGTFDWSANTADSSLVREQPGGMAIMTPRLVIRGIRPTGAPAPTTILRGATDERGRPVRPRLGTNAAFRNGPSCDGVTLRDLAFKDFENAVVLIQADTLRSVTPKTAMAKGTRGWTFERLAVSEGPFGIMANGKHVDLTVRDCDFDLVLPPHEKKGPRDGSFAVSVRPYPPAYTGLPSRVTIEKNRIHEARRSGETEMFGAIVASARTARIRENQVSGFGFGLVLEGDSLEVRGNVIENCRVGIAAWTTGRLGLSTEAATIAGNTIRDCTRQGSGFLSAFSGTALFLVGVKGSRIEGNHFERNAEGDIIFGALAGSRPSTGNSVTGNGGVVTATQAALSANTIKGSQLRVIAPPKPTPADSTGSKPSPAPKPAPAGKGTGTPR